MKTRISKITTVTFISLIILVGNIYADGKNIRALSYENTENALEVENWMVDDRVWNADDFLPLEMEAAFLFEPELALEVETEETLEVENWMVADETFGMEPALLMKLETALEIENEEALEIEDWMINDKNFNMANLIAIETETEQTLELESWMTDENIWNN